MLYRITNPNTGEDYGLFAAVNETDALDQLAQSRGCADYRHSLFCTPTCRHPLRVEATTKQDVSNAEPRFNNWTKTLARLFAPVRDNSAGSR